MPTHNVPAVPHLLSAARNDDKRAAMGTEKSSACSENHSYSVSPTPLNEPVHEKNRSDGPLPQYSFGPDAEVCLNAYSDDPPRYAQSSTESPRDIARNPLGEVDHKSGHSPPKTPRDRSLGPLERYIPGVFRFNESPPEATGLAMDIYARGTILMSSLFLGPALLQLASDAANSKCTSEEDVDAETSCELNGRIYGMKPSSLLSNMAIVSGLLGSIFLPLIGAVVDHTPFRREVGAVSAAGLTLLKGLEAMISSKTWFAVSLFQVISGIMFQIHICATYAYTSELSKVPAKQTKYNSHFYLILFSSTLVFLVAVLCVGPFILGTDDVGTARVSQVGTCTTCLILFGYAWAFLFRERPALSNVPEGSTLLKCGFQKIMRTSVAIWGQFPALRWFMLSLLFSEAATGALVTIATTYMSQFLAMNSSEIGIVFFAVLVAGIPGTKIGEMMGLVYTPMASARVCIVVFIVSTGVASMVLTGPERKHFMVLFGVIWGISLGWLHPMHTTIFCTIIPKGQESELMGMYILCGQVLSWLPPLLFTVLNEIGIGMNVGMASLDIFFAVGLMFLMLVGNYNHAVDYVNCGCDIEQSAQIELERTVAVDRREPRSPFTDSLCWRTSASSLPALV